ncbi:hypothetical protein VCHA53O466_50438 [Vibrio chagasii]|nr:hypothetical protein VCHA53O466_50438 [Vibrio chagasii]
MSNVTNLFDLSEIKTMESLFIEYLSNIQAESHTVQECEEECILTFIGIVSAMAVAFKSQHKTDTSTFLLSLAEDIQNRKISVDEALSKVIQHLSL